MQMIKPGQVRGNKLNFFNDNMKDNLKWLLLNLTVSFSFYWIGNLILWVPWSINPNLGITLMLTIVPLLWGVGIYYCLISYPGRKLIKGAIINSLILLMNAVIEDYIFFGLIRKALHDLYQPTTFYGYAFLMTIPFIEIIIFRNQIIKQKRQIKPTDFFRIGILGIVCLVTLIIIIKLDINIKHLFG
jgi:hypothetical protein